MTRHEFETELNELMDRRGQRGDVGPLEDAIPADLRAEAEADPIKQQMLVDFAWMEKAARAIPQPMPSKGFADQVVTALHARPAIAARSRTVFRWSAVAATLVAASLLLVVSLPNAPVTPGSASGPETTASNTPKSNDVDVAAAVRQGTEAYLDLVESVAETVPTASAIEVASASPKTVLVSTSPLSRAVLGSSDTLRSAGDGIRVSVQPIANTALDAFGFLWKPSSQDAARPSI